MQALIRIPRSLIVSRGTLIGGMGRSWTVPVYLLNGHFPDAFPADEDPVPFDGEAHPEHPPVVMGPHPQEPHWWHEQQGAAGNLGFFSANPHPNPAHPIQLDQQQAQAGVRGAGNMDIDNDHDVNEEMEVDAEVKVMQLGNSGTLQSLQMMLDRVFRCRDIKSPNTLKFLRTRLI